MVFLHFSGFRSMNLRNMGWDHGQSNRPGPAAWRAGEVMARVSARRTKAAVLLVWSKRVQSGDLEMKTYQPTVFVSFTRPTKHMFTRVWGVTRPMALWPLVFGSWRWASRPSFGFQICFLGYGTFLKIIPKNLQINSTLHQKHHKICKTPFENIPTFAVLYTNIAYFLTPKNPKTLPGAPKTIKNFFWYLKTRFFGGENLCFSWFWVPQVNRKPQNPKPSTSFTLRHPPTSAGADGSCCFPTTCFTKAAGVLRQSQVWTCEVGWFWAQEMFFFFLIVFDPKDGKTQKVHEVHEPMQQNTHRSWLLEDKTWRHNLLTGWKQKPRNL